MLPFLLILLLATIGVSVAWWIEQNKSPATLAPASQGEQDAATENKDLLVTPIKGPVPLRVTFAVKRDLGTVQTINYGDGTIGTVTDFICGFSYCTRVHVYNRAATYTGAFEDGSGRELKPFTIVVTRGE
jgi:hypothetical protein